MTTYRRPATRRKRLQFPIVAQHKLPGRKVRVKSSGFFVFLPWSVGGSFTIGHVKFTILNGVAEPNVTLPFSWLRRLT